MCNIEFPHFGASYPDAHCIDGYLWDMDSYEDGYYTIGGDDPCPFCNTEEWLKTVLDNEEFASREEALEWVEKMREKWGAEHRGSSEIPKDLEEAAGISFDEARTLTEDYLNFLAKGLKEHHPRPIGPHWFCEYAKNRFIAGAKWQKEQMMEKAVEGIVERAPSGKAISVKHEGGGDYWAFGNEVAKQFNLGDKVRIIIVKEDN